MGTAKQKPNLAYQDTSRIKLGGKCRREATKVWIDLAHSEARTNLINILVREGIGLSEIEEFELGLVSKFRSTKFKNFKNTKTCQEVKNRLVLPAMKLKLADEQCYMREVRTLKDKYRREISRRLGKNTNQYKKTIQELKQEARTAKVTMTEKFKKKILHLKEKYNKKDSKQEDEEHEAPEDLKQYDSAKIFNKKWYENLKPDSYSVKVIGDIELSKEEEEVLKMHPKFCVVDKISSTDFEHEQETALAKMRMEITREAELEGLTQEQVAEVQEQEAVCRQVYDPINKKYDARRRRATDLPSCPRVTLPKPLHPDEEAKIELRRNSQQEVFKKYMRTNADKNNRVKSNLTKSEEV